jgi:hypothetical protein
MGRLLLTLEGVVEAPVDRVADVVLVGSSAGHTEIDRAARMIAVWGDWWFRSETVLEPDGAGRTRVTQRIFDIAEKGRWAVRFVAREPLRAAPAAFDARLAEVGGRLGCRAYRVNGPALPG